MTAKITLTWDNGSSEHVDQIVYRSAETFTVDNLPPVLTHVGRNAREYIDTDIVTGNTYFYAVASENAVGEILLSSVIPVTAGASNSDPHWSNVVSLLHFDGVDGSTALVDEKGLTVSTKGAASLTTDLSRFGGASVSTESGGGVSVGLSRTIGNDDFTMELWFQPTSLYDWGTIFSIGVWNSSGCLHLICGRNAVKLNRNRTDSGNITHGMIADGLFYHVAVSRASGTTRLFIGGQVKYETVDSVYYTTTNPLVFASAGGIIGQQAGRFDEARLTVGIARYTENFTPPTEPFPNY